MESRSLVEGLNIVNMAALFKLTYKFNPMPNRILTGFFFIKKIFFWRNWQIDPKIHMKIQGAQSS